MRTRKGCSIGVLSVRSLAVGVGGVLGERSMATGGHERMLARGNIVFDSRG